MSWPWWPSPSITFQICISDTCDWTGRTMLVLMPFFTPAHSYFSYHNISIYYYLILSSSCPWKLISIISCIFCSSNHILHTVRFTKSIWCVWECSLFFKCAFTLLFFLQSFNYFIILFLHTLLQYIHQQTSAAPFHFLPATYIFNCK